MDDWGRDFYVARVQWISLQSWEDLLLLKLVTENEVQAAKAGLREAKNMAGDGLQVRGFTVPASQVVGVHFV